MDTSRRKMKRTLKPSTKRRRPPLACIQCYQRKVKCGKEFPSCSRCVRAGIAEECTYRGVSTHQKDGMTSPARSNYQEAAPVPRVLSSESGLQAESQPAPAGIHEMTHLRRRGGLIQFYGYSYHMNFYQQFPALRSYIAGVKAQYPAINVARDGVFPPNHESITFGKHISIPVGTTALKAVIPSKSVSDALVQTYLDRFETTHRVLDRSAFMAEYHRHWSDSTSTAPFFLAQLLLVLATGASLQSETYLETESKASIFMQTVSWIDAAESWLTSANNVVPHSREAIAGRCLVLIAKRANYIQSSSFWTGSGELMRLAMAAGYHREVSPAARISSHDQEIRRRLWTTIVELDVQAALERGMPPTLRPDDFCTNCPLHINDDKLCESLDLTQVAVPLGKLADTSFQVTLLQSLPTRLAICAYVNGCDGTMEFEQVQKLGETLHKALQNIPDWDSPAADPRQQKLAMHLSTLVKIQFCQYLLLLYTRFICQSPHSFQSTICRRARLDASTTVLECYRRLVDDEMLPKHACQTGLMVAALNICHEIFLSHGPCEAISMTTSLGVAEHLLGAVEQVLAILETRISRTLHGLNEYYLLSMIIGLVKTRISPETRVINDKQAANRAIQVCTFLHTARASLLACDSPIQPVEPESSSQERSPLAMLHDTSIGLDSLPNGNAGFIEDDFLFDAFLQDRSCFV
ncbi:uncharacterized protein BO66DRAFT_391092 [Aspergillus aculeatinus CBS 121060]|uniref:Uncharacterized protein n=1 Tax=Aspergillus aculeatinus CBS 121060 TaxID=1448322 RepID=A0ACD1HCA8_9EURO|nr:hypothetical protein BO66DRAFT_391092 [Aspergillus aculeatinus CBS 121060]RAH71188.1 hypothetical protein BO66DRAFT_391092 [Aspergillus aculeatinus CBS 121060]